MAINIERLNWGVAVAWVALGWASGHDVSAQSNQAALFVANNGNCEGSVTSFTVNGDGSLNFVQKVVTGSVPCGSGQTAPGLNAQTIDVSPNGRWLITGHGTISGTVEQLTFFEVFTDGTFSILFTTTTPDSPVDVEWIDDEYVAVTATPVGDDFVIIYHVDFEGRSITQHYYQPVPSIFDFEIDRAHDLLYSRAGTSGVQPFRINADRTITKLTPEPVPTGVFFLGPGLSPDGTKLYYGGGISSSGGLSSRWIGGFNIDPATGELTSMPKSPYLSPPSDGTSGPSPKEVDISSDGQFAYVNHGGTAHIKGFAVSEDGTLTPLEASYYDIGGQGDSGNMSVLGDVLYVTRKFSSPNNPTGVIALQINKDGTLTEIASVTPTQGTSPWDIAVWPGVIAPCSADVTGDEVVNVGDLLAVIGAWGTAGEAGEDVNDDGVVNVQDLLMVIGAWGPCD